MRPVIITLEWQKRKEALVRYLMGKGELFFYTQKRKNKKE